MQQEIILTPITTPRKNRNFLKSLWIGILMSAGLLEACSDPNRIFEKNVEFTQKNWFADSAATFDFEITDEKIAYNIYYNIRNTISYQYYNVYVTYYLEDAKGKVIDSQLQDIKLMDDKTGQPYGNGVGDIFEHQLLALKSYKFKQKGKYRFKIKQYMRHNPLKEIISIGIKLEKDVK
jgi:gliding motility-associated lipoprotein GldH